MLVISTVVVVNSLQIRAAFATNYKCESENQGNRDPVSIIKPEWISTRCNS